jgi:hypothetical protein
MTFGIPTEQVNIRALPNPSSSPDASTGVLPVLGRQIKVCSMPLPEAGRGSILRTNPQPDISMNPGDPTHWTRWTNQCPIFRPLSNPHLGTHYPLRLRQRNGVTTRASLNDPHSLSHFFRDASRHSQPQVQYRSPPCATNVKYPWPPLICTATSPYRVSE